MSGGLSLSQAKPLHRCLRISWPDESGGRWQWLSTARCPQCPSLCSPSPPTHISCVSLELDRLVGVRVVDVRSGLRHDGERKERSDWCSGSAVAEAEEQMNEQ